MTNSVDPDETAHYEPSHLDLSCLQKPIIIACGSEIVNNAGSCTSYFHYIYYRSIGQNPPRTKSPLLIFA